ncbi:MAG TPA: ProQ/FinO family protein, partial [Micropruina sp.]|nr:ProQ/FinO family protein [Micropruina sp.]
YPACFDGENPRPLKLGIHRDLMAAGFEKAAVKRALARYCNRPRYRKALRAGAIRIDLRGQPAGAVTADDAETARADLAAWTARKAGLPAPPRPAEATLPAHDTPLLQESLVPGRLELTVKFSELPQPLPVQGGLKIGIQTGEGIVTAILPPQVWRRLERAAQDTPRWVAALSGSLARITAGEIALQHPSVQVFGKPVRPEVEPAQGTVAPTPTPVPAPKAPATTGPEAKASTVPDAPSPPSGSPFPKLRLKARGPSETG